jgi:hypothetical protein
MFTCQGKHKHRKETQQYDTVCSIIKLKMAGGDALCLAFVPSVLKLHLSTLKNKSVGMFLS